MKKLLTAILIIITLFSCTKEIKETKEQPVKKELIINGKATEFK